MSRRQADDQFLLILKGQSNNPHLTDLVKQTVSQVFAFEEAWAGL